MLFLKLGQDCLEFFRLAHLEFLGRVRRSHDIYAFDSGMFAGFSWLLFPQWETVSVLSIPLGVKEVVTCLWKLIYAGFGNLWFWIKLS